MSLKIPAETQTGKAFRLRGKGIKSVRSQSKGDLICRVTVEVPVQLNSEQRSLLEAFQASLSQSQKSHSPRASSWFAGVKKFFEDMKLND